MQNLLACERELLSRVFCNVCSKKRSRQLAWHRGGAAESCAAAREGGGKNCVQGEKPPRNKRKAVTHTGCVDDTERKHKMPADAQVHQKGHDTIFLGPPALAECLCCCWNVASRACPRASMSLL